MSRNIVTLPKDSLEASLRKRKELEDGLAAEITNFNRQADGLNMDSDGAVKVLVRRIVDYLDERYGIL